MFAPAMRLPDSAANARLAPWALLLFGGAVLYVPSVIDVLRNAGQADDVVNALFVLGVSAGFLHFRVRKLLLAGKLEQNGAAFGGGLLLAAGLALYALGRPQQLPTLEIGSLIPLLAGVIVVFFGFRTLRRLWLVLLLLLFLVPLPASVAGEITQPVKIAVSAAAEALLHWLGYPVARDGAILAIGQYRLLVADACSGLRSLFTLETLGLMYLSFLGHASVLRNTVLGLLIVPISFAANTLRVVILALITYRFGDAAGQGFLHNFAGLMLFLSALLLIVGVDAAMTRLARRHERRGRRMVAAAEFMQRMPSPAAGLCIRSRPAVAVTAAMLLTAITAQVLTPRQAGPAAIPALDAVVPKHFGGWNEIPSPYVQAALTAPNRETPTHDQPYDAVLMRGYAAGAARIMLALAYAGEQRQDIKIHRPEVCYPAQGFELLQQRAVVFHAAGLPIAGTQLLVRNRGRLEAVSYWIRSGNDFPRGVWAMRAQIFRDGIAGRVSDGILVRASSVIDDEAQAPAAYEQQQRFLADLVRTVTIQAPGLLVPVRMG